jgi:tetratricopeptide (TPR) repeat protein/transcriptional regulator with XRE-family HTH domain
MAGRDRLTYKPKVEFFQRLRERRGLSIVDLAAECGVGERTMRKLLNGEPVESGVLDKVAGKLRVPRWHHLVADEDQHRLSDAPAEPPAEPSEGTKPPAPAVVSRLFQLPAAVADFTGREDEFRRMVERLTGGGTVAVSALRGMGGVGKTSLAVKVAHAVKDHFPDGQLVVELRGTSDNPVTPAEAMARVIRDFHPDAGKLPDTAAELLPLYRGVLAGKRALVLLDNARDEGRVQDLVTPPPAGFLLTSRAALALDGVESVRLDLLPPDEALALLRGIVGAKGSDDELRAVATLCGRLPLALRVAGDFLRLHPNWTAAKFIEALKDEGRRLERLKGKTREKDVEAVLALSARQLVQDNPEQAERWQALAVFPADFDSLAAAAVWDLTAGDEPDTATAEDELTALLDRSLVQFDEGTGRYSLHDLMRPVARDAFDYADDHPLGAGSADRLRAAERRFAGHYRAYLWVLDGLYKKGNEHMLAALAGFDREEANILAGWRWASTNREADRSAAELCRDYPNAGVYVIDLRLPARTRIVWLEHSVAACRQLGDRRGEGAALGNLGLAHAALGDARAAIGYHERHLAVAREVGDRRGEGAALGNLGAAHADLGDARAAIGYYERHLAVAREVGDRRGEANTNWNMAAALVQLGRNAEAIPSAERSLAFWEEIGHPQYTEMIRTALAEWRGEGPPAGPG